jgi:cell division control protein 6
VAQLGKLLRARLAALPWRVFEESAVDLCARRVAATSGDMRRALQAARGALEVARSKAAECEGGSAAAVSLVGPGHMAEALSQIFRSPVVDTIRDLPRDEQLVLCASLQLFSASVGETSRGELWDAYGRLCSNQSFRAVQEKQGLKRMSTLEFASACSALADSALISLKGVGRGNLSQRAARVSLTAPHEDVLLALQSQAFFKPFLALAD